MVIAANDRPHDTEVAGQGMRADAAQRKRLIGPSQK
jgi:hypothetical protein